MRGLCGRSWTYRITGHGVTGLSVHVLLEHPGSSRRNFGAVEWSEVEWSRG
jgi:hypothetical protein